MLEVTRCTEVVFELTVESLDVGKTVVVKKVVRGRWYREYEANRG